MNKRRIVGMAAAAAVAVLLSVSLAMAMPLPTAPPEVDDTPVSHEEEPEGFRDAEIQPQEIPEPTRQPDEPPLTSVHEAPTKPPAPGPGLDTGSIVLIGVTIWYAVTLIGLTGGRRGIRHRRGAGPDRYGENVHI